MIDLTYNAQAPIPLRAYPCRRGWDLHQTAGYQPSRAFNAAAPVWCMQIILIVLDHVVEVYRPICVVRSVERFRTTQMAPEPVAMLVLMVLYTMTSLWFLASPSSGNRCQAVSCGSTGPEEYQSETNPRAGAVRVATAASGGFAPTGRGSEGSV